jgi:hypothetical protein
VPEPGVWRSLQLQVRARLGRGGGWTAVLCPAAATAPLNAQVVMAVDSDSSCALSECMLVVGRVTLTCLPPLTRLCRCVLMCGQPQHQAHGEGCECIQSLVAAAVPPRAAEPPSTWLPVNNPAEPEVAAPAAGPRSRGRRRQWNWSQAQEGAQLLQVGLL